MKQYLFNKTVVNTDSMLSNYAKIRIQKTMYRFCLAAVRLKELKEAIFCISQTVILGQNEEYVYYYVLDEYPENVGYYSFLILIRIHWQFFMAMPPLHPSKKM